MDELSGDSGAYRAQAVLRLAGPLDVSALEASLTDIIRRHDVLRSRFVTSGGGPGKALGDSAWSAAICPGRKTGSGSFSPPSGPASIAAGGAPGDS